MMEHPMPFDHQPDPELGAALRRALQPSGHKAFVARVVARAAAAPRAGSWDVLAGWAGRGIAAALLLAAGAGFAAGRAMQPAAGASMDEALVMGSADSGAAATAVVRGSRPPDASIVFASLRP